MTTLELPDLGTRPEPRRDRWGRYLIIPAAGGKPRPYTRATTWAKALDDQGGLINWSMRMCALGLVQRKDLYAQIAAARKDDRDALSKLVEQAKEAGGGSEGANIGSALHAFTERVDLGETVDVPDLWRPDVDAYRAAIDEHGLQVRRDFVERVVVLEELGVAGTLDRVYVTADGQLVIGDVKTGQSLDFSRLAIAVQLALYANAETIYDLASETHQPMVAVDKTTALVVHVPSGKGQAFVHEVDIAEGWKYAQLAGLIRSARAHGKRSSGDCLFRLRTVATGQPTTLTTPPEPTPISDILPSVTLRTWIVGRLGALDGNPAAKRAMKDRWPVDVPKLASGHQHTDLEFRRLADVLDGVERDFSIPFGAPDPTVDRTPAPQPEPTPLAPLVDEGERIPPEAVALIARQIEALDPAVKSVLNGWVAEAHKAGVTFALRVAPTQRRLAIYQALLRLAPLVDDGDTDIVRATVALVHPDAARPAVPLGSALGALTIDEADRLADLAAAVHDGTQTFALTYGEDGSVTWATEQTKQTNKQEQTNR